MSGSAEFRPFSFLEKAILLLVLFLIAGCVFLNYNTQQVINSQGRNAEIGYGNRAVACVALEQQQIYLPPACTEPRVVALMRP